MPELHLLGGPLRRLLGAKQMRVDAGQVGALLDELVERAGDELATMLFESDRHTPNRDLRILVNGRSIEFLEGLATQVDAVDTVTLHFSGIRGYPGG